MTTYLTVDHPEIERQFAVVSQGNPQYDGHPDTEQPLVQCDSDGRMSRGKSGSIRRDIQKIVKVKRGWPLGFKNPVPQGKTIIRILLLVIILHNGRVHPLDELEL